MTEKTAMDDLVEAVAEPNTSAERVKTPSATEPSDAVEAMARAIYASDYSGDGKPPKMAPPYRDFARTALAAIEALGWAVVPRKATEAMLDAVWCGTIEWRSLVEDASNDEVANIYRAMLDAAPKIGGAG